MTTMQLSIDEPTKAALQALFADAKRNRQSPKKPNDVIAEMIHLYKGRQLRKALTKMQKIGEPIANKLGLKTDDDIYRYLSQ